MSGTAKERFLKAYNDLSVAVARAKRACRADAAATKMKPVVIMKSKVHSQRGRPKGSKDSKPRAKRRLVVSQLLIGEAEQHPVISPNCNGPYQHQYPHTLGSAVDGTVSELRSLFPDSGEHAHDCWLINHQHSNIMQKFECSCGNVKYDNDDNYPRCWEFKI
jgi:hypothetical protein